MTNSSEKTDEKNEDLKVNFPISFLWDKWKHHDSLAYSRWTSSLTFEVAVFAATGLALKATNVENVIGLLLLAFLSLAWCLASFTTYSFIKSQQVDVRVRNTFNREIVAYLLREKILDTDKKWAVEEYIEGCEDNNELPVNLWHTPKPFDKGRDTRATKWNSKLMKVFFWCNLAIATAFVLSTIYFIHIFFFAKCLTS